MGTSPQVKLLYLDCFAGIGGDMLLGPSPKRRGYGHTRGALIDLGVWEDALVGRNLS